MLECNHVRSVSHNGAICIHTPQFVETTETLPSVRGMQVRARYMYVFTLYKNSCSEADI